MKLRRLFLGLVLLLFAGWRVAADPILVSAGPFDIAFYNAGDGDGWNTSGANWTQQQIDDVAASVAAWSARIANVPARQARLNVFWYEFDGGILGGCYAPTYGDGTRSGTYVERVWRDGIANAGPFGGFDAFMVMDISGATLGWHFGSEAPASNKIDFRSVLTHELGHALGFYPSYEPTTDTWGSVWGTETSPYEWNGFRGLSAYDQNLRDGAGNVPANGSGGSPGNFAQTGPVYWTGSHAVSTYGGNLPIYAPNPYRDGSSLAHLDEATFPYALMSPFISAG
ncbi:MAG: hypothetical protein QHJ73_15205, partial [Armatimonadota bacterium]|nr:hypothetical protein [Armatimonadota bacterium]